ncbi:NAD(P)/FAD-dependent oxidoreductase [Fodinibius sp.]|uniref:NAD(P)/FAD-dependent oxidoreductase n=1 Tax=Fodinibius sp. TaxID=1872440 RepID=UPI0035672E8A
MSNNTLAVIGGGAAGFFAGVNAARLYPGLRVILFERSREVLSKVRISGGGRCNVTHHCFDPETLSMAYPRGGKELRWAFEQFQARDTVTWFNDRGVDLKTEEDGRMFPVTDDSATIISCLKKEARKQGVEIRIKSRVGAITPIENNRYTIDLRDGKSIHADAAVIATGGSNRSRTYDWIRDLGHTIVDPVPSLFTFNFRRKIFEDLAGISLEEASVTIDGTNFQHQGPLLITHWGLSGPAVLKTSAWAARYLYDKEYRFTIRVNWVPPKNEEDVRGILYELRDYNARKLVNKQDRFALPNRLWKRFVALTGIDNGQRWAELSNNQIHHLAQQLTGARYEIQGKTTYKDEFVTSGGVPLTEINTGTMESTIRPRLYFAGEVLNIDGITGGYNFQSAWTTGWIAARHLPFG